MATVIRTNVNAIHVHRQIKMVGSSISRSSARLSSGLRINTAADDAAGLGISEKMRSQIRGLDQASRNGLDGVSLIQTAEGALETVNEMLIRIRELVIQAANDTNVHDDAARHQSDRKRIQDEINQLIEEIDSVSVRTEFNTRTLLDGTWGITNISLDTTGAWITAPSVLIPNNLANNNFVFGAVGTDSGASIRIILDPPPGTPINMGQALSLTVNKALNNLVRSALGPAFIGAAGGGVPATDSSGVIESDFNNWLRTFFNQQPNGDSPDYTGAAVAPALTPTSFNSLLAFPADGGDHPAANEILTARQTLIGVLNGLDLSRYVEIENSLWFQIGANTGQGFTLNLNGVNASRLGLGFRSARGDAVPLINVERVHGKYIQHLVTVLDNALSMSTSERSRMGAIQNRIEFTVQNLDTSSQNLSAAQSRIRDADMALEMTRLSASNVIQQAAISMMGQANQTPQNLLQLLNAL